MRAVMGEDGYMHEVKKNQYEVNKSDEEWRAELSTEEYHVLRQAGTERPGTGELLYEDRVVGYSCRAWGAEVVRSPAEVDAVCGWPRFYDPRQGRAVRARDG